MWLRGRIGATAAACLALALLAGCGERTGAAPPGSGESTAPPTATPGAGPELPAGWRWESFGGVQVAVPGDWGWTNGNQRIGQWCVDEGAPRVREPAVGRPGVSTLVGCNAVDEGVPHEMLVRNTGDIVALQSVAEGSGQPRDQGDRLTVTGGGVAVIIQTSDADLRRRIADTVHHVDVDSNGCPARDPSAQDPRRRPPAVGDVSEVAGVTSVTACKYATHSPDRTEVAAAPLLASRRFDGPAATDLVDALVAAPEGSGPNAPETCMPEYSYGDELTVLLVHHAAGTQRVVVTYSGCDHNGTDDGTTRRRLTREVMQPLTDDALTINGGFSGIVHDILAP